MSVPITVGLLGTGVAAATPATQAKAATTAPAASTTKAAAAIATPARTVAPSTKVGAKSVALPFADAALPYSVTTTGWSIIDVPAGLLPYQASTATSLVDTRPHDSNGVRKVVINGHTYDHPVGQAALALSLIDGYRVTKNSRYLTRAIANADRLLATKDVDTSVVSDGAWFYPYPFDFSLHRYPAFTLRAPWYSGMAQGQALSVFSRLYELTKAARWKDAADHTFASFLIAKRSTGPWVVNRDQDGHLWLEEYASSTGSPKPDRTFNGHNFATAGLYDYYQLSKDKRAGGLLDAAMTSVLARLPLIRQPGWKSHYCLAHPEVTSAGYHAIHIGQLLWFHQFTGDARFARWADLLEADYPTPAVTAKVVLLRGVHVGRRFSSTGTLLGSVSMTLNHSSSAPIVSRERIHHRSGVWYQISAGKMAGTWVLEAPSSTYLAGTLVRVRYKTPRTVLLAAGVHVGIVSVDRYGRLVHSGTITYPVATTLTIDARGIVNGVERLRVSSGKWKLWWITAGQGKLDASAA